MKKNLHSEQQKFFIQRQTSLPPFYKNGKQSEKKSPQKHFSSVLFLLILSWEDIVNTDVL